MKKKEDSDKKKSDKQKVEEMKRETEIMLMEFEEYAQNTMQQVGLVELDPEHPVSRTIRAMRRVIGIAMDKERWWEEEGNEEGEE